MSMKITASSGNRGCHATMPAVSYAGQPASSSREDAGKFKVDKEIGDPVHAPVADPADPAPES
eukprot:8870755-Pyramimonas_sp.AAC.1